VKEVRIYTTNTYVGFGQVHLGVWNGKYVAIKKFITKEKQSPKYSLNKFIKEINIISNLRHPNIVLYMGASINKNEYYMISEYIPKGSLFDYLHVQKNKFNDYEMINIAYEVAIALKYLHSRKITHCDLKSSNILLDENMKIKVSDFGLSRLKYISSSENKGRIGTPHWMPPEIMKGKKYLEASDVYSYGMILWELVTCEIPYYRMTPNQIIGIVADCGKIVELPSSGHVALRTLIKHCLVYQPERRPTFDYIIKYLDKVLQKTHNDGIDLFNK
jgi:serine/threonine protein kinase